jgi:hypothetical protein
MKRIRIGGLAGADEGGWDGVFEEVAILEEGVDFGVVFDFFWRNSSE